MIATAVDTTPTLTGATGGQLTSEAAPVHPFAAMAINDVDVGKTETLTVTLGQAGHGVLGNLGAGHFDPVAGTYTLTGSNAQLTAALQALTFAPTLHQVTPGSTVATSFTVSVDDGHGGVAQNATTTVIATAVDTAPTLSGTAAGQLTSGGASLPSSATAPVVGPHLVIDNHLGLDPTSIAGTTATSNDLSGTPTHLVSAVAHDNASSVVGTDIPVIASLPGLAATYSEQNVASGTLAPFAPALTPVHVNTTYDDKVSAAAVAPGHPTLTDTVALKPPASADATTSEASIHSAASDPHALLRFHLPTPGPIVYSTAQNVVYGTPSETSQTEAHAHLKALIMSTTWMTQPAEQHGTEHWQDTHMNIGQDHADLNGLHHGNVATETDYSHSHNNEQHPLHSDLHSFSHT